MSAAKMVADSTQGDSTTDNKKRKKKTKKSVTSKNKVVLPEDEDSDLDLKKDLHPIGFYLKDRCTMIEEMFHCVRGASLQRALPELLKSMPIDELKELCLEQLEVMSNKRLQRILAGEESANISSSGTDDMDDDEEEEVESSDDDMPAGVEDGGGDNGDGVDDGGVEQSNGNTVDSHKMEGHELAADSTSTAVTSHETVPSQNTETKVDDRDISNKNQSQPPPIEEIYIKQEPPDSEPEERQERNYRSRHSSSESSRSRSRSRSRSSSSSGSSYRRRRRRSRRRRGRRSGSSSSSSSRSRSVSSSESEKASLIEGGYEEPPEAYTSGSEDGELVRKEVVNPVTVKQEVMSETEDDVDDNAEKQEVSGMLRLRNSGNDEGGGDRGEVPSGGDVERDLLSSVTETTRAVVGSKDAENDADEGSGDESKDSVDESSDNVAGSVVEAEGTGEKSAPPSIAMDQMELLELEMRARAIKAMLMTSAQVEEGGEKKTEGV